MVNECVPATLTRNDKVIFYPQLLHSHCNPVPNLPLCGHHVESLREAALGLLWDRRQASRCELSGGQKRPFAQDLIIFIKCHDAGLIFQG